MRLITDTFVTVAPDSPATSGVVPVSRGASPTVASIQYELLAQAPYTLTLEDLMFATHVLREGLSESEASAHADAIRERLFAKPYPCMRASPLPKRFGWGVHHDREGRIALHAVNSDEYRRFAEGLVDGVEVVPAMRSKRAPGRSIGLVWD